MTERSLEFLRALPDIEPPPALWPRIERAQKRRRVARRVVSFAVAASVLVAVFVVGSQLFVTRDQHEAAVATAIARSHVLERDLVAVRRSGAQALSLEAELARVDADLSRAYARRAGDAELRTLWNARVATLETLVAMHRHPDAIRI